MSTDSSRFAKPAWASGLPSDWQVLPIKKIVSTPITDGPHETPDFLDEGVIFISAEAIQDGKIDFARRRGFISEADNRRYSRKYSPETGDIYVVKSGATTGKSAMVGENADFNIWSPLAVIRSKSSMDSRFVLHTIRSQIVQYAIAINWSWGTQQNIGMGALGRIQVPIPDLATQRQIANFLDRETARIGLLIEKREKFASLVAEARDSLVATMICGESSEKLDTTRNDWTDARPENWKSERAKIYFRERIEKSVDGSEELLTVSHITGVTTRAEKDVNMFLAESNKGYKIVHPGDIVINTMWGWMGAMGVSSHHGIISPSYGVYRPTSDAFDRDYLDLMLRSKPFVAEVTRRSKGIHSSRLRIYPDAFLDMRLPVPPRDEQFAILAELRRRTERENALLAKNEQASALLKEYRSALITAAVTGQIDVTTYTKSGTPDRRLDAIQEEMGA
ncbi:restriction endonuclease subunit S [Vannielia litorea]|uniref:Type I restriction enzyme, S subunit n=1 Tax=Vannielia litorea TaxID=1217970 RepID=A0A1N6GWB9_9RHOB|nr:restriction endonuclease subunit S [Vannielia litorea]SIO11737.1 type I restriction enzyme, S subunit [Vannielia litorea]